MEVLFKESNIFYNVLCFLITENEKLFDRSDAKLYWRTVLHIFSVLHQAYVGINAKNLGKDLKVCVDDSIKALYTFRLGYLTGWNVVFQTVFLFLALAHDVLEWTDKHGSGLACKLKYWRDVIFSGLVVPYTCFVFTMFWSLYAIDRELVFPKVYDDIVPWWFNQCVHTNILVMMLVETVLQERRYPADRKMELVLNASVGIAYAIVYYSIYFLAHRWLYNVFGIMTWWQVCIFQCCIWISSYIFYIVQFPINRLIHGQGEEDEMVKIPETQQPIEETKTNGEVKQNGTEEKVVEQKMNGEQNGNIKGDLSPSFVTKSWSLKYRTTRNQFENSSL